MILKRIHVQNIQIALFAVCMFCVSALGSEQQMLNTLVERGILTEQEACDVKKKTSLIQISEKKLQSLTLNARLQYQYSSVSIDDNNISETIDGFQIRRIYIGAEFIINSDWDALIMGDLLNGTSSEHKLTTTYIRRKINTHVFTGNIRFGFDAETFSYEDNISSGKLLTIERSIATRYFSCDTPEVGKYNYSGYGAIKFGADSVGIFASGYLFNHNKIIYGAAITSPESCTITPPDNGRNIPSFWGNVRYIDNIKISGNLFDIEIGSYVGIAPHGSVVLSEQNKYGYIYGINPFAKITDERFTAFINILMATIQYGRPNASQCTPWGMNAVAEYKFSFIIGEIAPVFGFSYLDTDGRGTRVDEPVKDAISLYDNFRQYYDKAISFSAGLNWYIYGDDLRFQLSYERAILWDEICDNEASKAHVDVLRMQLQLMF